jgi:hypothetical protein
MVPEQTPQQEHGIIRKNTTDLARGMVGGSKATVEGRQGWEDKENLPGHAKCEVPCNP